MKNPRLYFSNTCPYSQKVLRFIEKNNILLDKAETSEGDNLEKLVELGGMDQVPALFVNDEMMYESDDIIKFLGEKFDVEVTDEDLENEGNFCPIF